MFCNSPNTSSLSISNCSCTLVSPHLYHCLPSPPSWCKQIQNAHQYITCLVPLLWRDNVLSQSPTFHYFLGLVFIHTLDINRWCHYIVAGNQWGIPDLVYLVLFIVSNFKKDTGRGATLSSGQNYDLKGYIMGIHYLGLVLYSLKFR